MVVGYMLTTFKVSSLAGPALEDAPPHPSSFRSIVVSKDFDNEIIPGTVGE